MKPAYLQNEAKGGAGLKPEGGGHGGEGGFSLVEVVVAAALLVLSLAAFIVSFVQSSRSSAIAENRIEAVHNARQKMESLLNYSYNATQLNIGTHYFSNGYYTVSNNAASSVKDIVVVTRWVNPMGRATSTVSLAGSISEELHK